MLSICTCVWCQPPGHGWPINAAPTKKSNHSTESSTAIISTVKHRTSWVTHKHDRTCHWLDLYESYMSKLRSCGFMNIIVMLCSEDAQYASLSSDSYVLSTFSSTMFLESEERVLLLISVSHLWLRTHCYLFSCLQTTLFNKSFSDQCLWT